MPDQAGSLPLFDNRPGAETDTSPTARMPADLAGPAHAQPLEPPPAPAGSGPLVRTAWPLLSLLGRISAGIGAAGAEPLKDRATALVHGFERSALAEGINARDISAARYVLCTAIDEAVLTSPWGASIGWNDPSLLSVFHNETWGGEKVFTLIDRAMQDPAQYGDLLELCHFVMLLGFQGRFRLERDGSARADALRRRLYELLRPRFGTPAAIPVPQPEPVRGGRQLVQYVPVWVVGAVCLLFAFLLFGWYDYRLNTHSAQVARLIHTISFPGGAATSAITPAFAAPTTTTSVTTTSVTTTSPATHAPATHALPTRAPATHSTTTQTTTTTTPAPAGAPPAAAATTRVR
ncbi:MAG: type IVB secretion system protein IcmH/DotU [Acetobacteraceae bacterium]